MKQPIITIENIKKSYPRKDGHRKVDILDGISFTIYEGEFLVLLGPSGCGKSTLLRILSGLDTQTSGTVSYSPNYDSKKISFVFQDFGILPWLTVSQNIMMNLIESTIPEPEHQTIIHDLLDKLGLTNFKDHFPHQLSGGMRQRVGLARAFANRPSVIYLDEPFSELDFFTAKQLREFLLDMWRDYGTTVIMVSHYIDEAVILADRIVVFSDRPSHIQSVVENNLARPRDHRSSEFFAQEDNVLGLFGK